MSVASSTEGSPSQSPSLSPSLTRRLSSRRGSISASDPWGAHASVNMNPTRSSSSRLTIVRVAQATDQQDGRNHRRHGSNASISSTSSKGESNRLSFAFTSFTPINRDGGRPGSPGSSPRLRPASPGFASGPGPGLSRSNTVPHPHTKLSPEKLVELARSSCNPRTNGPTSPLPNQPTPVSFAPLPDDVYLPFVDRPAEVASLISIPPSSKLLALLSQTFPPEARASADEKTPIPEADSDAHSWTYAQLEAWLKRVKREDVDDATWVRKARHCILPRSELIWERIKGALGIPPELDTDDPIEDPLAAYLGLAAPPTMPPSLPVNIPRGLGSHMLDSDVFEPDSPAVSIHGGSGHPTNAPPSPVTSELELSIEPVLATAQPPPPMVDPTTGENMTSLHEVREEDEEKEEGEEDLAASQSLDVQGLRISTSSAVPGISPILAPHSLGTGRGGASPSPRRLSESEQEPAYDALNERGPGHPLFPSNFAQLSMAPTLRGSSSRSNSMSFPPLPAFGLRRSDSASSSRLNPRPDWARGWDMAKHEDAITTSSVSVTGAE